ncbi:MAG: hypothetical protein ABEJ62_01185 [Candidatus Nanohaloarchaea archaeon]
MQLGDIDTNLKYLILTVLILLPVGAAHNIYVSERSSFQFGMCTTTYSCQGAELGDTCIGIEKRSVSCVDPMNASKWRRAEAECGLDAQALCNANPSMQGMDWLDHPNATWNGRSCEKWREREARVDLLSCSQTTMDITNWDR